MRIDVSLASALLALSCFSACAADDIVVYRTHGEAMSAGGSAGDDAPGEGGVAEGGRHGGTPSSGAAGAGGSVQLGADAAPPPMTHPASGGTSTVVAAGGADTAGGAPAIAGAGGGIAGLPGSCSSSSECPSGWNCVKLDCVTDTGVCQPRQPACDLGALAVCGCDGVTYWNDCYRQQNGVGTRALGQCTLQAASCTSAADCNVAGASCAHLSLNPVQGPTCGAPASGTCWVVPSDCTATPAAPLWTSCGQPSPGQPPRTGCMNTCAAIRSGESVVSAAPNAQCR